MILCWPSITKYDLFSELLDNIMDFDSSRESNFPRFAIPYGLPKLAVPTIILGFISVLTKNKIRVHWRPHGVTLDECLTK